MAVSLDNGALEALVEWVAAIQEEKDLEPITAFSDLVTYDDDGDLPLVSFLQLVDEEAFASVNAHGDSGTYISHSALEADIFPALSACLAHAAEVSAVDLQHLGVEADGLTGDDSDESHRAVFLACLLYASVHSAQRGDFIGRIMALEQATQQQLMGSIQTITTALKDAVASDDEGDEHHVESEDTASLAELRAQVRDLMLQNEDLTETNQHLQAKLDAGAGAAGASDSASQGASAAAGGADAEALLTDLRMTEAELQRTRDAAEADKTQLQSETQALRDEVEVLRQKNRDLASAEADAARLRAQLEKADELEAQLKHSQSEAQQQVARILDLEEAAAAVPELKKQVEHYKRERVELDAATSSAKIAADAAKSRIAALQQENEEAQSKLQQLESELSGAQAQVASLTEASGGAKAGGDGAMSGELREKLMRLERENAALKKAQEGGADGTAAAADGDSSLLRSQLEDAQAVRSRLEERTAAASAEAEELKTKLQRAEKELAAAQEAARSDDGAAAQLAQARAELEQAQAELSEHKTKLVEAEAAAKTAQAAAGDATASSQEVDRLRAQLEAANAATEQLSTRNTELKQKVDKLTQYASKLSAQHKTALAGEQSRVQELKRTETALKEQLRAKENAANMELDRMSAALHNLGRELQRFMLQGGAYGSGTPASAHGSPGHTGLSFLQQQRSMRSPLGQRLVANSRAQASVHGGFASPLRSAAAAGRSTPGAAK